MVQTQMMSPQAAKYAAGAPLAPWCPAVTTCHPPQVLHSYRSFTPLLQDTLLKGVDALASVGPRDRVM